MERLTKRMDEGIACLSNVKQDEQVIEGSRNTLQCLYDSWQKLAEYEDTGLNPSEVKKLKEKQMPKPLMRDEFGWNVCPNDCTISGLISNKFEYCPYCGQKIDRR